MMLRYEHVQNDPRVRAFQARLQGRPGWVWLVTVGAAVLVVVLPLLLLTLAALVIAAAVFAVASLVAAGLATVRRLWLGLWGIGGRDGGDGRRNVRVIDRRGW